MAAATKPELLASFFASADVERGVFSVRVFKGGKWRVVTIDDRLPAKRATRTLMYAAGVTPSGEGPPSSPGRQRIMWLPLLEKAYAKAHGCYENLAKGTIQYGLKDLTGGAPQVSKP